MGATASVPDAAIGRYGGARPQIRLAITSGVSGRGSLGVQTLTELGILFGYGFMLFDPSSSFEWVRENIAFLRQIVGDGSAAAVFSRMLPYRGTPIRDQLQKEGRLRGDLTTKCAGLCRASTESKPIAVPCSHSPKTATSNCSGWSKSPRSRSKPEIDHCSMPMRCAVIARPARRG